MKLGFRYFSTFIVVFLLINQRINAQCYNCGTGAEGAKVISTNQTLSGEHNYTSFTVNAGVTLTVTGSTALIIHATGNVVIDGKIDANGIDGGGRVAATQSNGGGGKGGNGGLASSTTFNAGTNGTGPGAGLGATCAHNRAGGGAGYRLPFKGGDGGCSYLGGSGYADDYALTLPAGSGGGGSSSYWFGATSYRDGGAGGGGGGAIAIFSCGTIAIGSSGSIQAKGGLGTIKTAGAGFLAGGNGGGGSGGCIYLSSSLNSVINNGNIAADGGWMGGPNVIPGGSDGVIRIDSKITGSGTIKGSYLNNPFFFDSIATGLVAIPPRCKGELNAKDSLVLMQPGKGYKILWSNGDTNRVASNLSPGNYSVTITNANGCSKSLSNTVEDQTLVKGSITTTVTSTNTGTASGSATGGTAPYGYSWSNGQTGVKATGFAPGSYSVTITDANGCTVNESFTVIFGCDSVFIKGNVTTTPTATNTGTATVMASGGSAPYTYSWSNGQTTATASDLGIGDYFVTITDAKGCKASEKIKISMMMSSGIADAALSKKSFTFSPNPSKDRLNIAIEEPIRLMIRSLAGEIVLETKLKRSGELNISALSPGIYIIQDAEKSSVGRFVKE